uniref:Uncharacterized protein n=1 Tax=Setaria viridis TaxID=4556 RepID=A0A4U6UDT6_SETVI|nr:hypothetical protein SEVIR_6G033228v2 [Setaria viridis]TKW08557.1 hypothetical protein SEVIR_6G033312v2 [Setaria viridis]
MILQKKSPAGRLLQGVLLILHLDLAWCTGYSPMPPPLAPHPGCLLAQATLASPAAAHNPSPKLPTVRDRPPLPATPRASARGGLLPLCSCGQ